MIIKYRKIDELKEYQNNPRDNDAAVEKVAESIRQFGFNVPILVDENGVIVAGHTRLKAARSLGMEEVPVIVLDELDDDLVRQYRIVDNKTAELSCWDFFRLNAELESITEIDMEVFGFADFGEVEDERLEDYTGNLDKGIEIDPESFGEDAFNYECPYCGFRWNE